MNDKKGILVVSFGTSHEDTRAKTIEVIEKDIQNAYPDIPVYRAWTSKMIIQKLKKKQALFVMTVKEAMEKMKADGITQVYIQPTHIINGTENDFMKEDALTFQKDFSSISFGDPLLTGQEDYEYIVNTIPSLFPECGKDRPLVFMGHGTAHYANTSYAALSYQLHQAGYSYIFLACVEAYPELPRLMKQLSAYEAKKITLAPFMVVAGDHAKNDMAGRKKDSWASQIGRMGIEVTCSMKGLGEYSEIRNLFLTHLRQIIE